MFALLLLAAMRYCILKKNNKMLMGSEVTMAPVYSKPVRVFYKTYMTKELPSVLSPVTRVSSIAIARLTRNDVPMSYAKD
jgi:hypothetical protein